MVSEIKEQFLENIDDSSPCPHCHDGRIREVERNGQDINLCTSCYNTTDGTFRPPKVRESSATSIHEQSERPRYNKSGYVVQYGAFPAHDSDDEYDLDDGTASYDAFIAA